MTSQLRPAERTQYIHNISRTEPVAIGVNRKMASLQKFVDRFGHVQQTEELVTVSFHVGDFLVLSFDMPTLTCHPTG